jgi:hypothetical protein
VIVDWPADLPDLSPIELLWAIMEKIVRRMRPVGIADLKHPLVPGSAIMHRSTLQGIHGETETLSGERKPVKFKSIF